MGVRARGGRVTVDADYLPHSYKPGAAMLPEAVPFPFLDPADLVVTRVSAGGSRIVLAPDTYVLAGDGSAGTATIRVLLMLPVDDDVVVRRATSPLQRVQLPAFTPLPSRSVERALDRASMVAQEQGAEQADVSERALKVSPGQSVVPIDLTAAAGKLLAFDPITGQPVPLAVDTVSQEVRDDFDAYTFDFATPYGAVMAMQVRILNLLLGATLPGPGDYSGFYAGLRPDAAGLTAIAAPFAGQVVLLPTGAFVFRNGDFTAAIAADPGQRNYVAATAVLPSVGAWVRIDDREVSPLDFGAACDGVADDWAAMQAAANYAMRAGKPLTLRPRAGGWWRVSQTLVLSYLSAPGASNWTAPPIVDGCNALIQPHASVTGALAAVVAARNTANITLRNLQIDGSGHATTLLDTSWDVSSAPSRNNLYEQIGLRGASGTGSVLWNAASDNDSVFLAPRIAGDPTKNQVAIDLPAAGGHARILSPSIFNAVIRFDVQSLTIHDGVTSGLRPSGNDDNVLVLSGAGYHYASVTGINIEIAAGARVTALSASGRFENSADGGAIIGGTGKLTGGADFVGAYIFRAGGTGAVRLVGAGVTSLASGYKQTVRLRGGRIGNVDYATLPAEAMVSLEGVYVDALGGILSNVRRLGGANWIEEDGEALRCRQVSVGYGPVGASKSAVTGALPPSTPATVTIADAPRGGILSARLTNDDGPSATFAYAKHGSAAGAINRLASSPGVGGGEITLSMPAGAALAFVITHSEPGITAPALCALAGIA